MSYSRTEWRTEETPLSAANMNNIEDGVEEALDGVQNIIDNFASLFLDVFYPVGSYYETSNSEFNPGTAWGGTWILETPGMVHVSGGSGYTVAKANNADGAGEQDGGNKDAIVPYHNHGFTQPTVTGGRHSHVYRQWGDGFSATARSAQSGYSSGWMGAKDSNTEYDDGHTHTVSGGAVAYAGTSGNTVDANMQPYINIYRWHRTA